MLKNLLRVSPLLALLALVMSGSAVAQFGGKSHTQASVVVEKTAVKPGESLRGAFHLEMEGNWHTYWKNAGDVGLPTEAEWTLPDGWTAEPLLWPAPEYLETAGLISYAYEHHADLPFVLLPPPDTAPGTHKVKVKLSWLECEEACVPGEAELSFSFTVGDASLDSEHAEKVGAAFDALPKMRDDISVSRDQQALLLHLPTSLGSPEASFRFFPDTAMQISAAAPQELGQDGDGARFLKLQPEPTAEAPPEELSGVLVVTSGQNREAFEFRSKVLAHKPSEGGGAAFAPDSAGLSSLLLTIAAAFVGGLVLNLMPCVFPVLSLKVLGIVEQSRQEGSKAWHHGAVFTVGVLVSFWVLSGMLLVVRAAGQEVGWGYHLQNPAMIAFLAALFLLIGLNLFGLFEVGENLTGLSNVADQKKGFGHSFWSGVLTTLAATPCTAPFMGGAVGFALSQPAWVAMLVFTFLALGVATPYLTLTMFPALLKKLPKPGAWMITFKQVLAFPMLLAVVWLAWVFGSQAGSDRMALLLLALLVLANAAWVYGKWGSSYQPKTRRLGAGAALVITLLAGSIGYQASQQPLDEQRWQTFSPQLVEQLVADGKPVFVDFTADWCTSCKANEIVTLSRADVNARFESLGVELVKGDWTKKDPVITEALAKFGRAGVPLYVLYPGQGADPILLPEVLLPPTLLDALDKVSKPS